MDSSKEKERIDQNQERQVRFWGFYQELERRVAVEIRRGYGVYHIVPTLNHEIKVRRTDRLLLTRGWPLCGKVKSLESHRTEPVPTIHTLCAICARAAFTHLQKLNEEPKDE